MVSTEFLSRISIFENLSEPDLEVLRKLWKPRLLKQGDVLFRKDDVGNSMFIIQDGIVEISVPDTYQKKDIRISVLREGEFVGELSLIDGQARTANAIASDDCRLLEMKRDDFLLFLMERPSVAISMVGEIGKRLRATNDLVTSLASKNVNEELEEQLRFGDRLSDRIAEFGGSWKFIILFGIFLLGWMVLNTAQLWFRPFDEFPFIFLNLMLSTVAALQAPVIMMSQNRAGKKDRLRAELDYQVNLKSELMLQQLHAKFDELRAAELRMIQESLQVELVLIRRSMEELDVKLTQIQLPEKR
jgi:uncharacterized membrane protein